MSRTGAVRVLREGGWAVIGSPNNAGLAAPLATSDVGGDERYLAALMHRDHAVQDIARWFRADHLPQEAMHSDVARAFQAFTLQLLGLISDDSAEMTVALHKLLEAKDMAVRAAMS